MKKLQLIPTLAILLFLTACAGKSSNPFIVGNERILSFDEAMSDLVDGLNQLSNKEKNFGMLADDITVSFNLKKTNQDTLGISFEANANATGSTKVESFSVERNEGVDTASTSQIDKIVNKITETIGTKSTSESGSSTSNTSSDSTSDSQNQRNNSSEEKHFSELKNNLTEELTANLGAKFNASYNSVETGEGSNLIQIKFKNIATYPVEKINALAKNGMLGCLPFYIANIDQPFSKNDEELNMTVIHALLIDKGLIGDEDCEASIHTTTESPDDAPAID